MTSAKIILDSISPSGARITTMQIKFHRMVLAEFDTHRRFTRNFSSSRAIPTKKLLEQVRKNPAMPVWWGKNQSGMQAKEELTGWELAAAKFWWKAGAKVCAGLASVGSWLGVHKQIVNRMIEPFVYVEGIVTSTEWDNFFELRCHPDAQPEIQALAYKMREALQESTPTLLQPGEWHLPYIADEDRENFFLQSGLYGTPVVALAKISAARCCRVSYLKHDGTNPNTKEDLSLFDRLAGSEPIHASPLEHQAQCVGICNPAMARNFSGWHQFRALYETGQV